METSLVRNVGVPPSDVALMQALQKVNAPAGTVHAMSFGVEDAQGRVYRVVRTSGLCETVRVFESARALGFDIGNAPASLTSQFQKVMRARVGAESGSTSSIN